MTIPSQRPRYAPNLHDTDVLNVVTGGPYQYHLGDVITPGASAFIYDSPWELLPLSIFGRGGVASVCCRKFTWDMRSQQAGNIPTQRLVNQTNGGVYTGNFGLTSLIPNQSAAL